MNDDETPTERRIDVTPGEVDPPEYAGLYPVLVREIDGRNTTLAVHDHAAAKHGVQRGTRVVVSSSWLSGTGYVDRVTGAAPIDGGALCRVVFDDGRRERVPLVAIAREDGGEPYLEGGEP
jgi:hypothetical protein